MAATLNTTAFLFAAATDAYSTLRRIKGVRPSAVRAFLANPESAVDEWGAGLVRRGLREAAVYFESHDDQETANVFWTLRDSIDTETDEFFDMDSEVAEDVEETVAS